MRFILGEARWELQVANWRFSSLQPAPRSLSESRVLARPCDRIAPRIYSSLYINKVYLSVVPLSHRVEKMALPVGMPSRILIKVF